jgi:hypothetical protein
MDPNYQGEKEATRLAKVEARTEANVSSIERITNTLDKVWNRIEDSERAILNKIDTNLRNRQITWPLIFSAVVSITALLGVAVLLFNGALNPMRVQMRSIQVMATEHYRSEGHLEDIKKHARDAERAKWVDKERQHSADGITELRLYILGQLQRKANGLEK